MNPISNRTLTDADLEALSDLLIEKIERKFLLNIGRGVMKYVWAAVLGVLIYLAAAGYKPH